jgi:copper transport protein
MKRQRTHSFVFSFPKHPVRRRWLVAFVLALGLSVFLPGVSFAHAVLLRADPAPNAVLPVAPDEVRMWFSEAFNPALSTAVVVNAASVHVDIGDAHVSSDDPTEMDVDLHSNLPPDVYVVVYRTVASDDGHVIIDSFRFTVARADGSVPTLRPGANPGANVLGSGNLSGQESGQLDGPALFNLIMITLVEMGAVFFAGASIWHLFVLQPAGEDHTEERELTRQTRHWFERRLALPTLFLLLLANTGVLLGQALSVTNGNWDAAFAPSLLITLLTTESFGLLWLVREVLLLLLLQFVFYQASPRQRGKQANTLMHWLNLVLSLAFFLALALSSHAAAADSDKVVWALLADWLHLLAAALWVGGMFYLATSFLPVVRRQQPVAQARALTTVLPYYTPWALAGVLIMAITGPFSATVQLSSWEQLFSTVYGRVLLIKVLLVGGMLLTSALHVFLLRLRVQKAYRKYTYAQARLSHPEKTLVSVREASGASEKQEGQKQRESESPARRRLAREVSLREARLEKRTRFLTRVLGVEPLMGVAVLVCVGLLSVFGGTLEPIPTAPTVSSSTSSQTQALHASARTSDGMFSITLQMTPGRVGSNALLATVQETATHQPVSDLTVTLAFSDQDMDMGTQNIALQADGNGHYGGLGDFLMGGSFGGHWQIRIQVQTPDHVLHIALVNVFVAS